MSYWISRGILWLIIKMLFCLKVQGKEHVPTSGGFILAPNHASYVDPPVVGCALPRKVHYMAKKELFSVPVLGSWMRAVGTFPVKRGSADRAALHQAVSFLKSGECVCVFPEGRRVRGGDTSKGEKGLILLAAQAKVPILPAVIIGTQPLFRKIFGFIPWFSPLEVRFGPPIHLDFEDDPKRRDENYSKALQAVMDGISSLKLEAVRV